jgi:hypothetical protein
MKDWVVWSFEHDGWWRLGSGGYTRLLAEAGRYTEAEAREIEQAANITGVVNEKALPLVEAELPGELARPMPRGLKKR